MTKNRAKRERHDFKCMCEHLKFSCLLTSLPDQPIRGLYCMSMSNLQLVFADPKWPKEEKRVIVYIITHPVRRKVIYCAVCIVAAVKGPHTSPHTRPLSV